MRKTVWVFVIAAFALGTRGCHCGSSGPVLPALTATRVDSRFNVSEHMRASYEMQLSGEPFAQLLGYNLAGFDRTLTATDQYSAGANGQYVTDPLGYALAVESYEYSKQPMNNVSFESGAGLSLQFGPLINPQQVTGDPAVTLLASRFQLIAAQTNTGGPPNTSLIVSPACGSFNATNPYGWPGIWMEFAEFSSFDPAIGPTQYLQLAPWKGGGKIDTCVLGGGIAYGSRVAPGNGILVADYECDYNSLNLSSACDGGTGAECRDSKVTKVLTPDTLGYVTWKQGLWAINYWGTLHDMAGNGITSVARSDIAQVGQPGNKVVGQYVNADGGLAFGAPDSGVWLGDIPIEGIQGLVMMTEIDNKSAFLLGSLLSANGTTLQGASSTLAADDYSYDSPLLYFPAAVSVVETPTLETPIQLNVYFPKPTSLTIADGTSQLAGVSGLIGGFAEAFAFTDRNNMNVGGSVPFLATFYGDGGGPAPHPFPQDDGQPDGENTLHDRALGILKIALVDLDRLHYDSTDQVLVDSATVSASGTSADGGVAATVTQGTTVTTVELVESILALRNAYRALNGSLQLYSNDTPDTLGCASALDATPLTGAPYTGTLAAHIITLIGHQADFLSNKLIDANGAVSNSYDLSKQMADSGPTLLESEAGAVRGLLDAYLATNNESYRQKAIQVYADLQKRFWMTDILCFQTTAGVASLMQFTPIRFGLLSGALRQYYKLVASTPGNASGCGQPCDAGELCTGSGIYECPLLQQMKRMYKLVLNGWNDRNQDDTIQYPDECMGARMEMGERALTGELGHPDDTDRDNDCVKDIAAVDLPAALAAQVDLARQSCVVGADSGSGACPDEEECLSGFCYCTRDAGCF
jgi:hypothetical protein